MMRRLALPYATVGWLAALIGAASAIVLRIVDPAPVIAASTVIGFALFQPIRRRGQRAVDQRFDRSRYDAEVTVRTFAERLRDDLDLGTVGTEIVKTASATVRPSSAAVWLRGSGR